MKAKIAAKIALFLTKNDNGKKILAIAMAIVFFVVFVVPAAAISLPGLIVKGFFSKVASVFTGDSNKEVKISDEDMDAMEDYDFVLSESDIYEDVKKVYLKYNESLNKKIDEHVKKIQEDNTYTIEKEVVDEETGEKKTVEEEVVPEVIRNVDLEKPKIQYVLAYITTKYLSVQTKDDEYEFDEEEMKNFLDSITTLYESTSGTDPITYTAYTVISDEYEIAANEFGKSTYPDEYLEKQEQYLVSYESFLDIDDKQVDKSYESNTGDLDVDISSLEIYANGMKIPHFLQYDNRWGNVTYGNSTIRQAGCGITSMAMILNYFDYSKAPPEVANWSMNHGYYVRDVGTSWSFFGAISNEYGITCDNIGRSIEKLVDALSSGKPVIASMSPGTFTQGGHFIVLRGITKEGKILINDPNDNTHDKNFYKREFSISLVINECKNMWTFSK